MCARKLWIYVSFLACFGTGFSANATEFEGVPLPENTSIVLAVVGEGVQIYECKPNSTGAYVWALQGPEAELKSLSGEVLGKHFRGPTWSLNDGRQLVGNSPPLKSVNDPDGRNIAWLLLGVKSKAESGILSKIDCVMRIATSGGVAPAVGPKNPGDTVRVNYKAIYLFLRKQ